MKRFTHTINVDSNNNRVISHTESDWRALRKNSLISIDNDEYFYEIINIEKINLILDASVEQDKSLIINGNYEYFFLPDDIINISYKEYELFSIKRIINNGVNYHVGDIINIDGGQTSIDTVSNSHNVTKLKVDAIDSQGGITNLSIVNKGLYILSPQLSIVNGGHGNEAELELIYNTHPQRSILERQILSIKESNNLTYLELNYDLPTGIKDIKLSCSKYQAILDKNYNNQTKRNVDYHISRDHTPNLHLPFLLPNSDKKEIILNHIILELDKKISSLSQEVELLKAKIK